MCELLKEYAGSLYELGKTENEIVERLKSLGLKGHAASPRNCILAKYLQKKFNNDDIRVGSQHIYLYNYPFDIEIFIDPVASFQLAFDKREYKELLL